MVHFKTLFLSKEIIWTIMAVNFIFMYMRRAKAWKLFNAGDIAGAKAKMKWMPNVAFTTEHCIGTCSDSGWV